MTVKVKFHVLNKSTDKPYGVTRYLVTDVLAAHSIEVSIVEIDDDALMKEKGVPQQFIDYIRSTLVQGR